MDITDVELKEKLVKADKLMVVTEKELLAVIKIRYTESTFQTWCKTVCDARDSYKAAKEHALLINKIAKIHRLQ